MKPVIAVPAQTAVSSNEFFGEQRLTSLYDLYVRAIRAAGGLPIVLAQGEPSEAAALLDRCDGLLIPGGGDTDPSAYGELPTTDHLYGIRSGADQFEFALVREAAHRQLPVLGICRGLQVINVAFGGSLHQHLPEHPRDLAGRAFAGRYLTQIQSGSRLCDVLGTTEVLANSLHHQGVKRIGTGLTVTGTARDGVVESIEATDRNWDMIAVQWHPECLRDQHAAAIFDWFVAAARVRMGLVAVRQGSAQSATDPPPQRQHNTESATFSALSDHARRRGSRIS
jgi:putative glutamine amidotransferase